MAEVFTSLIRPLGSSACVLIPKEQLNESGLKLGDSVEVALLPHKKALSAFGIAAGFTKPFVRDKKVREFK